MSKSIKTPYFGVSRTLSNMRSTTSNPFNRNGAEFRTLGDRIISCAKYGADIGVSVSVSGDEDNTTDVDILASANHDFFDIAEITGQMVDAQNVPPVTE